MLAASSPNTTATRSPDSTRSSSRSTARFIWTSGATSARPRSRGLPANSTCWPTASPRSRSRNCGPIGRRLNSRGGGELLGEEKGPLTLRERPKSREETPKEGDGNGRESLATALQQHTPRCTKDKGCWPISPGYPNDLD